jgi:osmoprotectant transport system substrate-binding protein
MRISRTLVLGAVVLALIGACAPGGGGAKPTIKVGSVGFDEAKVMAELYAQALEAKGYTIERHLGLGTREVVAPAIESAQIDLQPEYIGSRLRHEGGNPTGDAAANLAALQEKLTAKNLTVLAYTPAVDTNAFVVRRETAEQFNLTKLSDTAAVQGELRWALATDCATNAVCGAPGGALSQYGITPETIASATLLEACSTPMSEALRLETVDLAELCSTSPEIIVNDWVMLEDDLRTQPADNVAPIIRNDLLAKVGDRAAFDKILNDVSAKVTTPILADLYKQVAVDRKDAATVARDWLRANGFVQ